MGDRISAPSAQMLYSIQHSAKNWCFTVLPQMHDRVSADETVILYSVWHNAKWTFPLDSKCSGHYWSCRSVLPQMHDRGSVGNAVILYTMEHNAQNPSCIDLCISQWVLHVPLWFKVLWTLLGLLYVFCHRCTIEDLRVMLLYCTVCSTMPKIRPALICAYLNEFYMFSFDSKCYGHSWSYYKWAAADARSRICG
jgi:hypothetical protein